MDTGSNITAAARSKATSASVLTKCSDSFELNRTLHKKYKTTRKSTSSRLPSIGGSHHKS